MTQITRRQAVRAFAAGATAIGAGALAAPAATNAAVSDGLAPEFASESDAAFAIARRLGAFGEPRAAIAALARVGHCRSWDSSVYLHIDSSTHGFVRLSPQGFAIAAAAQVAGRPVVARCWGHDPIAHAGVGQFEGAHLALDEPDFPDFLAGPLTA